MADHKTKTHPQEIATEAYSITVAVPAPTITRLAPTSGWTNGDTKVTILGTPFSGATKVDFGSIGASAFAVSANGRAITAYTAPEAAGPVSVTVTTPSGSTTATRQFTFVTRP